MTKYRAPALSMIALLIACFSLFNSFFPSTLSALAALNEQTAPTSVNAAVNPTFNYQGTLRSPDGSLAKDGEYNITFRIYDTLISGNKLHEEAISNVAVRDGQFSVVLGDTKSFSSTVFAASPRYLGIAVNGEPEMIPRQQIRPVPWALMANIATVANSVVLNGQRVIDEQNGTVRIGNVTNDGSPKQLALSTNGFDQLWVTTGGNVGIGTDAPSKGEVQLKLDVEGNVGASKYCDQNGNNCKDIASLGLESLLVYREPIGCGGDLTLSTTCSTLASPGIENGGNYMSCDGNSVPNNEIPQVCQTNQVGHIVK